MAPNNTNEQIFKLDPQGGELYEKQIQSDPFGRLSYIPIPNRKWYQFKGWTKTKEDSGEYITKDTQIAWDTTLADNITIYAQWEAGRYPFRMYGNKVEIYRYKVDTISTFAGEANAGPTVDIEEWIPELLNENGNYFVSREEADIFAESVVESTIYAPEPSTGSPIGPIVEKLNTSKYQWMDGITVDDVEDTYSEAIKIYEIGKIAYGNQLAIPDFETYATEMFVDLDYRTSYVELYGS